jgi:hypothetical protein
MNLYKLYQQATEDERNEGREWYTRAHEYALSLSERYNITLWQAAGVLAALSPGCNWERNKRDAEEVIAAYKRHDPLPLVGSYGRKNVRKCELILRGRPVMSVLGGDKVISFYHNILDPLSPQFVTIDRHAYDALQGSRTPEDKRFDIKHKRYRDAESAYTSVAASLDLLPSQLQAIVWLVWRRLYQPERYNFDLPAAA